MKKAERKSDRKTASLILPALRLNISAHQVDKVIHDRQAKAAADLVSRAVRRLLFKRLVKLLQKLRRHADSVILNRHRHVELSVILPFSPDYQHDSSVVLRVLDRI